MKFFILLLAVSFIQADQLSKQCELAMNDAVRIHVKYMEGVVPLSDSYNVEAIAKKICKS